MCDRDRILIFWVRVKKKRRSKKTVNWSFPEWWQFYSRLYFSLYSHSHCVKITAASRTITSLALVYSDGATTLLPVWNGRLHMEAFDAASGKKREKLVLALSVALAEASRQFPELTVTAKSTALLLGLSWRRIIEYHVTRPVTARRFSWAACSVRSRGPRDVSFGNRKRPTDSCRGAARTWCCWVISERERQHLQCWTRSHDSQMIFFF